ncbi:exodeoxyribonuclease VII large subunit [Patescibacteria group bacterium]|nr:exodeoxyribonuclease VII large subunit [Patescibacteria group bacterium]
MLDDKKTKEIIENNIFTVSSFLDLLNLTIKQIKVKVQGEVVQLTKNTAKGHVYFSIKDKKDNAVMNCAIWKFNYQKSSIDLEEGMEIVVNGNSNIYKPNGRFTFIANTVELLGEGALKKAYDELKLKLEKEGLMDEDKKKIIPKFPKKIGVITSRSGAVINDLLNNLGNYGYQVKLIHSSVEGAEAIHDLLPAIKTMKCKDIDVLCILRGGGSLESFASFNNENFIREVANFPVPVISGLGHDKDIPLTALVSDYYSSTPTGVASYLNDSWNKAKINIDSYEKLVKSKFENYINILNSKILESEFKIKSYIKEITNFYDNFLYKLSTYLKNIKTKIGELEYKTENFRKNIESNNPEKHLKLGYSIIRDKDGKIVSKKENIKIKEDFSVTLSDGNIIGERIK